MHRYALIVLSASILLPSPVLPTSSTASTARATRQSNAMSARCKHRTAATGTITVSDNLYSPNLNPTSATPEHALFDDLFGYDSHGRLYPMMAQAVPTLRNGGVRDSGRTIRIQLKHGLLWSNGSEITSADIKFGWRMGVDQASGPACGGTCDVIQSIATPDRYTAILHLHRVDPAFISPGLFFFGNLPFVWPAHWPGWTNDPHAAALKLYSDPAFTFSGPSYPTDGPYQVVRATATKALLRPMKYYDDMNCGASIRKLVFTTYNTGSTPSSAGQLAAAAAGAIDVGLDYGPENLPNMLLHHRAYRTYVEPTFSFEHLEFNLDPTYQGKPNPLSSSKVRLALALALDKLAVIRTAFPFDATHARQIEAWTPWVHTARLQQPYADPQVTGQWDPLAHGGKGAYLTSTGSGQALADAHKLLAATPWKHGFTLDFYTTPRPARVAIMAVTGTQWARLGVKVSQHATFDIFNDWDSGGILAHGAFQAALFTEAGGSDPDDLAPLLESRYIDRDQASHNSSQNQNFAGIRDRLLDRALEQATGTFNRTIRKRDFWTVQERINHQAYWIPLFYGPTISSSDGRVAGFTPSPQISAESWNIYDWKIKGR